MQYTSWWNLLAVWCSAVCVVVVHSRRLHRLAGAQPAEPGDFPYLAALLHPEVRCTGSIISSSWVMSAAHCSVVDGRLVTASDLAIVAGVVDFNDTVSSTRQHRFAHTIYPHPNYQELKIAGSDIALVRLLKPFDLSSDFVSTIGVSGEPFMVNADVDCTATGWGDTRDSLVNSRLHKLRVTAVQSKSVCHGLSTHERKNMICLRNKGGAGLCDGDSGGPLICNRKKKPAVRHVILTIKHVLTDCLRRTHLDIPHDLQELLWDDKVVGVAHQVYIEKVNYTGPQDMDCGSKTLVHTYMFVCPFLDWIRSYVPDVPGKPKKCFVLNMASRANHDYDDS